MIKEWVPKHWHWPLDSRIVWLWGTVLLFAGCAAPGTVRMIPTDTRRISTTEPLVITLRPSECHYWIDDSGDLWLALRSRKPSLFGRLRSSEMFMTAKLKEPPAATSRDYPVTKGGVQLRRRAGLQHIRAESLQAIAAVWDYGKPRLRGRFRVHAQQRSYSVLTGWTTAGRVLIVGEFTASENREKGEAIRDAVFELDSPLTTPREKLGFQERFH